VLEWLRQLLLVRFLEKSVWVELPENIEEKVESIEEKVESIEEKAESIEEKAESIVEKAESIEGLPGSSFVGRGEGWLKVL